LLPFFRGTESEIIYKKICTPAQVSLTLNQYDTTLNDEGILQFRIRECAKVGYNLASFIVYDGTSTNGHYRTVSADGYLFDDNKVRLIVDRTMWQLY